MPLVFVLTGPDVGLEREVSDGALFGRGDDCAVHMRDASVSRRHARLERKENGYELVDLGSRNGISGAAGRAERIPLAHGMEFFVGSVRMRFVDQAPTEVEELEIGGEPQTAEGRGSGAGKCGKGGGAPGRRSRRGAAARDRDEGRGPPVRPDRGAPASLLRDDLSQQSPFAKLLLVIGALALAGGLGYAVFRMAAAVTPKGAIRRAPSRAERRGALSARRPPRLRAGPQAPRGSIPRILAGAERAGQREARPIRGIREQPRDLETPTIGLEARDEARGPRHLGERGRVGREDGGAEAHRLEERDPEALVARGTATTVALE